MGALIAITITRFNNYLGILGDHTPSRELATNKITPIISDRGAGGGFGRWWGCLLLIHMVIESIEEFGNPIPMQLHTAGGA